MALPLVAARSCSIRGVMDLRPIVLVVGVVLGVLFVPSFWRD
jgi:hypothetical protein